MLAIKLDDGREIAGVMRWNEPEDRYWEIHDTVAMVNMLNGFYAEPPVAITFYVLKERAATGEWTAVSPANIAIRTGAIVEGFSIP